MLQPSVHPLAFSCPVVRFSCADGYADGEYEDAGEQDALVFGAT